MSPILWDLGHIAHFEELWLTRNLDGPIEFVEMPGMYNPFEHPRSTRGGAAAARPGRVPRDHGRDPRPGARPPASADFDADQPLLRDGYVYRMVLQHEYQHNETILQTLQLKQGAPYSPLARVELPAVGANGLPVAGDMVRFPGGRVEIGTDDRVGGLRQRAAAARGGRAPFWIDAHPVTNGDFLVFIAAGGYARPELLVGGGLALARRSPGASAPKYWFLSDGGWMHADHGPERAGGSASPGLPRLLVRGRGVRALRGQAAADRDRVGGGGVVGSGHRAPAALPVG